MGKVEFLNKNGTVLGARHSISSICIFSLSSPANEPATFLDSNFSNYRKVFCTSWKGSNYILFFAQTDIQGKDELMKMMFCV